jgi:hypothetical protein
VRTPTPFPPREVRWGSKPWFWSVEIRALRSDSGKSVHQLLSDNVQATKLNLLSGIRVRAHPPPPAPVSLVAKLKGSEAVEATIISSDGCETPRLTRWAWLSLINSWSLA